MKKLIPLLLIVIILGCISDLQAQSAEYIEGYILNRQNEKIEGLILDTGERQLAHSIKFKKTPNSSIIEYTSDDLQGFFFEPSFHYQRIGITLNDKTENKLLRKYVQGPTSLYRYTTELEEHFIVIKNTGEQTQVSKSNKLSKDKIIIDNAYVGKLKSFLKDCNEFYTIKNIKWNAKSLSDLIMNYNECVSTSEPSTYLGQKRKLKIRPGIVVGYKNLNLDVSNLQEPKRAYKQDISSIQFGAYASLFYYRKLSLQIGALYNQLNSETEIEFTLGTLDVTHDISFIEIPVSLRYNLSGKRASPYLIFGVQSGVFLNGESSIAETIVDTPGPIENFDLDYNRIFGMHAGIGYSFQMTNNMEGSLELSYARTGLIFDADEDIVLSGLNLNGKVSF